MQQSAPGNSHCCITWRQVLNGVSVLSVVYLSGMFGNCGMSLMCALPQEWQPQSARRTASWSVQAHQQCSAGGCCSIVCGFYTPGTSLCRCRRPATGTSSGHINHRQSLPRHRCSTVQLPLHSARICFATCPSGMQSNSIHVHGPFPSAFAGLCPEMLNRQRTVGSKTALCTDPTSLGRIVIGGCRQDLSASTKCSRTATAQTGCSHALVCQMPVCLARRSVWQASADHCQQLQERSAAGAVHRHDLPQGPARRFRSGTPSRACLTAASSDASDSCMQPAMQQEGTPPKSRYPACVLQAGRQGSKRQGEVFVPKDSQQPNPELLQGASYRLPHMRPGEQPLRRGSCAVWGSGSSFAQSAS